MRVLDLFCAGLFIVIAPLILIGAFILVVIRDIYKNLVAILLESDMVKL